MQIKKLLASLIALAAIPGAQAAMPIEIGLFEGIYNFTTSTFYTPIIALIIGLTYLLKVLEFGHNKLRKRIGLTIGTIISETLATVILILTMFATWSGTIEAIFTIIGGFLILLFLNWAFIYLVGGTEYKGRTSLIFTLILFAPTAVIILLRAITGAPGF